MTLANASHRDALKNILDLDVSTCGIEVCLASLSQNEPVPEFKRVQLTDSPKEIFRHIVATVLADYKKDMIRGDLSLLDFTVETKPASYELEYLAVSQYRSIADQIKPLASLYMLDTFQEERSFIEGLRFYIIILQPRQGAPIYFYRHYTPKRMLSEAPFIALKKPFKNRYEYEDIQEPVFLFDKYIDTISRDDDIFILKKEHFYYMFRFLEELVKTADEALERVRTRIPILNFSLFAYDCKQDKRKMQKIINIAQQPYLDTLTLVDIKRVVKEHRLKILIWSDGVNEVLQYDPDDKWAILHLLDDDYLKSLMTDKKYAVDGKRGME